jgi:alkylated DNA repair dioxygenase AlkB
MYKPGAELAVLPVATYYKPGADLAIHQVATYYKPGADLAVLQVATYYKPGADLAIHQVASRGSLTIHWRAAQYKPEAAICNCTPGSLLL